MSLSSAPQHRSRIPTPTANATFKNNPSNATEKRPSSTTIPRRATTQTISSQQKRTAKIVTRATSVPKSRNAVKFQFHDTLIGGAENIPPQGRQQNFNVNSGAPRKSFAKQKSTLAPTQPQQQQAQTTDSDSKSLDSAFKQFPQHSTSERIVLNFKQIGPDLRHSSKKSLSRTLRDTVKTLCLSQNNIESVRGIAFFRNLESLSLAHNKIESMSDLEMHVPTEVRTRKLRHLILRGNPVCSHPDYRHECLRIFPSLETLDQEHIAPEERTVAINASRKLLYIYLKLLYIIEEHHTLLHKENLHLHVKLELYRRAYGTHQAFCRYDMPVEYEERIMRRYREGRRLIVRDDGTEWTSSGEILRDEGVVSPAEEALFADVGGMSGTGHRATEDAAHRDLPSAHDATGEPASTRRLVGSSSLLQDSGSTQCTIPHILQLINQVAHPNLMNTIVQQWKNNIPFTAEENQFGNRLMLLLLHLYESQYASAPDIEQVRALRHEIEHPSQDQSSDTTRFQVYSSNARFLRILRMLLVKKVNLIQDVLRARAKILNTNLFALTVPGVVGGPGRSYTTANSDSPPENPWAKINNGKTPLEVLEEQRHERLSRSVKALQQLIQKLSGGRASSGSRLTTGTTTKQVSLPKPRTSALLRSKRQQSTGVTTSLDRSREPLAQSQRLASTRVKRLEQVVNRTLEEEHEAEEVDAHAYLEDDAFPEPVPVKRSIGVEAGRVEPTSSLQVAKATQAALREKAKRIQHIIESHRERLGQLDVGSGARNAADQRVDFDYNEEESEIESIEGEQVDDEELIFVEQKESKVIDQMREEEPRRREHRREKRVDHPVTHRRREHRTRPNNDEETVRQWNQLLLDRRTEKQLDALAQAHHESQLLRKAFYALRDVSHEQRQLRIVFLTWQIFAHRRQCYRKAVHKLRHVRRTYFAKQCLDAWRLYTKKKRHLVREEQVKRYHEQQRHRSTSRGKERVLKGGVPLEEVKTTQVQYVRQTEQSVQQQAKPRRRSVDTRMIRLELTKALTENIRSQQRILKTLEENLP